MWQLVIQDEQNLKVLVALEMVENVKVRIPFTPEISVGFT